MEISTPRQLLRSLGPLPETSARTPPTSEKSLHELFQSGGWLENCLIHAWKGNGAGNDYTEASPLPAGKLLGNYFSGFQVIITCYITCRKFLGILICKRFGAHSTVCGSSRAGQDCRCPI